MARVSTIVTNFRAGEISPRLEGRIDLDKYNEGAQTLQNMIVFPQGGVTRRPGTFFAGAAKGGGKVRLINFEFSDEQAYVIELGADYMRFFKDGGLLTEAPVTITNITQSDPAVVTAAGHDFVDGDRVFISNVSGMTQINNLEYHVIAYYDLTLTSQSTFTVGETIRGSTSNATATVISNDGTTATIEILNGTFDAGGETVTGLTSGVVKASTGAAVLSDEFALENPFSIDSTGYDAYVSGGSVGKIVEVTTSYNVTEIFELNYAQSADVLYLAHKDHAPAKLTRTTATSFTLEDVPFTDGPYLDENIETTTLFVTANTGTMHVVASAALFDDTASGSLDIGRYIRFREVLEIEHDEWGASTSYANNATIRFNGHVYKQVTGSTQTSGNTPPVHTEGTETYGTIDWQYEHDDTGYVKILALNNDIGISSKSGTYTLGETITGGTSGATGEYVYDDGTTMFVTDVTGLFQSGETLTGGTSAATSTSTSGNVFSTRSVKAEVQEDDGQISVLPDHIIGSANPTKRWSLGAFGGDQGYPRAVAFYEQRLYFAGTTGQSQTIFGSVSADFENHTPGTNDDDALNFTIASDKVNVIKHILPARFLQILTTSAEFTLSGGTGSQPVTPTNVNILRETTFGTSDVRPLRAGNSTILIQKGQEKVKEITFDLDTDGLLGIDLSILADHITRNGVSDMVWQQEPELILWFVHTDGRLIGLTYDRANNAVGWHTHPLGGSGTVESITSIPEGSEDTVYVSVKRVINGATVRHIEYMKRIYFGDDVEDAYYVDGGLTYDGSATTTISSINHLEGETVSILADGASHADKTVTDGKITLDRSASKVHLGYNYTSLVQTLRLEAGADDGIAQGKIKRIHGATVRFLDTVGAEVGTDTTNLDRIPFRSSANPMNQALSLFTGDKEISFPSGYDNDSKVMVRQNQPLPMTILAIMRRSNTFDA